MLIKIKEGRAAEIQRLFRSLDVDGTNLEIAFRVGRKTVSEEGCQPNAPEGFALTIVAGTIVKKWNYPASTETLEVDAIVKNDCLVILLNEQAVLQVALSGKVTQAHADELLLLGKAEIGSSGAGWKSVTIGSARERKSLRDLANIGCHTLVTEIRIENCTSLTDIDDLAKLASLQTLALAHCYSLSIANSLCSLASLTALRIDTCFELKNFDFLAELTALRSLDIAGQSQFKTHDLLAKLGSLISLRLGGCRGIKTLSFLAHLPALFELLLSDDALANADFPDNLSRLTRLYLLECKSLTNIDSLAKLSSLTALSLRGCVRLTRVDALAKLKLLTQLDLGSCISLPLESVDILANLPSITNLVLNGRRLKGCKPLTNIEGLTHLTLLTSLDLTSCDMLTDLSPVKGLSKLSTLKIGGLARLKSIEPLRTCVALRDVETDFDPGAVAELLSDLAGGRRDLTFIAEQAPVWLEELKLSLANNEAISARLAESLVGALILLQDDTSRNKWKEIYVAHDAQTVSPWAAFYGGIRREHGPDQYLKEIELVTDIASPFQLGGLCLSLPKVGDPEPDVAWARAWLRSFAANYSARSRELLAVAPEICLACARLELGDELEAWLKNFTAPRNPEALDAVYEYLALWELEGQRFEIAEALMMKVDSQLKRDGLVAMLAKAYASARPESAGQLLIRIASESVQDELACELMTQLGFTAVPVNVARLLYVTRGRSEKVAGLLAEIKKTHAESSAITRYALSLTEGDPAQLQPEVAAIYAQVDQLLAGLKQWQ